MISFTKSDPLLSLMNPKNIRETKEVIRPRKRKTTLGQRSEYEMQRETVDRITFDEMRLVYEKNTWVRACVDKIVTRLSMIPPKIIPIESATEQGKTTDEQLRHSEEIAEFLINPNSSKIKSIIDREW